jgi:hypothetical protein
MCMYVCMRLCVYVCMYIYVCMHVCMYIYVYIYIYMRIVCMYVCMYACMYFMHACILCMYVWYACVYVCMSSASHTLHSAQLYRVFFWIFWNICILNSIFDLGQICVLWTVTFDFRLTICVIITHIVKYNTVILHTLRSDLSRDKLFVPPRLRKADSRMSRFCFCFLAVAPYLTQDVT